MMSAVKSRDTKPEMIVRRGLHRRGFRFRLNERRLPGRPDLVLARYRVAIFVHGCFWHGHDCPLFRWPKSREEFWRAKILRNVERDEEVRDLIGEEGWRMLTVWECTFRGKRSSVHDIALDRIAAWLAGDEDVGEIRGSEDATGRPAGLDG